MEADLHIHSHHSNDCRAKPRLIVEQAMKVGLGAIAVTDHDSWEGAREAAKLASDSIIVIPGAEIKTQKGDVLALFVREDITSRDFLTVVKEIRAKGGISVVPHPGDSPKITKDDIGLADGIEAFNSTCSRKSNEFAAKLAEELHKPAYASSDAHLVMEIGNGRTTVPDCHSLDELREVILKDPVPSRKVLSNPIIHRTNEAINFGLKGIWRR